MDEDDDDEENEDDDIEDDTEEVTKAAAPTFNNNNVSQPTAATDKVEELWAPKMPQTACTDKDGVRCCTVILPLTGGNSTEGVMVLRWLLLRMDGLLLWLRSGASFHWTLRCFANIVHLTLPRERVPMSS